MHSKAEANATDGFAQSGRHNGRIKLASQLRRRRCNTQRVTGLRP